MPLNPDFQQRHTAAAVDYATFKSCKRKKHASCSFDYNGNLLFSIDVEFIGAIWYGVLEFLKNTTCRTPALIHTARPTKRNEMWMIRLKFIFAMRFIFLECFAVVTYTVINNNSWYFGTHSLKPNREGCQICVTKPAPLKPTVWPQHNSQNLTYYTHEDPRWEVV